MKLHEGYMGRVMSHLFRLSITLLILVVSRVHGDHGNNTNMGCCVVTTQTELYSVLVIQYYCMKSVVDSILTVF